MSTEYLLASEEFRISRNGRFVVAELLVPHRVLSTSTRNGGEQEQIRYLVNHQSCEPSNHNERQEYMMGIGLEAYHDVVCAELNLDPALVAMMGTAANMNNMAIVCRKHDDLCATAVVTAGVESNATCSGDPARWVETAEGWRKLPAYEGTINTMLLIDRPLTRSALARAVVTMAEAKSAALNRLAVRSRQSQDPATGTGTDQYCVASATGSAKPLTSTSPHVVLGELIGTAVRDATLEALRWQNGLEASYTRSLLYALRCYGITEESLWSQVATMLSGRQFELLKANSLAVFCDPLVSSSAYAIAAVLDRARYGTLPENAARAALCAETATLATHISARSACWTNFYAELVAMGSVSPACLILKAICLGWSAKWAEPIDRSKRIDGSTSATLV